MSNVFLDVSFVPRTMSGTQKALGKYLLNELMNAFLGYMSCSPMSIYYFFSIEGQRQQ